MKNKISFLLILILAVGCSEKNTQADRGNAVSGTFTIFVDKNSYPLVKVLSESFLSVYPEIEISFDTGNGNELLSKISSLEVQSAVSCRSISTQDSLALASRKIYFRQFHFVSDAVAVITNKNDSMIVQKLSDPVSLFTDCEHKAGLNICTTNPGSDINYSISQLVPGSTSCMNSWINAENAQGVFSMVSSKTGYAGLIPWCMLSDSKDPLVKQMRGAVNILSLNGQVTPSEKFTPVQTNIATNEYPLVQKLYLITSESYSGPATGFAAYVASAEGQRVIRLFGLLPAKMPTREIVIP